MLSDVLLDAVIGIGRCREEYPFYDADTRMGRWLDTITTELEALAGVVGAPPPADDRTWQGECQDCHQITTIRLDTLSCGKCRETNQDLLAQLVEIVATFPDRDPEEAEAAADAQMEATRRKHLDGLVEQATGVLQRLSRADRDYVLDGITRGLLEAR